jgi:hypothetical protein
MMGIAALHPCCACYDLAPDDPGAGRAACACHCSQRSRRYGGHGAKARLCPPYACFVSMSAMYFEILSPEPLNREADARRIIDLWANLAPEILPDRVGSHEPLKQAFSTDDLRALLVDWENHVLFKRVAKPKLQSSIFMQYGPHKKHSSWTISVNDVANLDIDGLQNLLERASMEFSADFAFLHRPMRCDLEIGLASRSITYLNSARSSVSLFVTTHLLRKYVPDIYWVTVFGQPYVKLFSRERLLSAPAYRVSELDNGSVLVQLTESLDERDGISGEYQARKNLVKDHLNSDAFFDLNKGADHRYQIPDFVWKEFIQ